MSENFDSLSEDFADTPAVVKENADAIDELSETMTGIAEASEGAQAAAEDSKKVASGLSTLVYGVIGASLVGSPSSNRIAHADKQKNSGLRPAPPFFIDLS